MLPTYNEASNIEQIVRQIRDVLPIDILIVDDNSPDGTAEIAERCFGKETFFSLLRRKQKLGLASAYIDGFRQALSKDYDAIVQMDSDFSHDPKHIREMLEALTPGGLIIGSKYTAGGQVVGLSFFRTMLSRWGNRYIRAVLRCKYHKYPVFDSTSGYMCWSTKLLQSIPLNEIICHGYGFLIELKWRAFLSGAAIKELPIVFRDRVAGQSKLTTNIFLEALILPLRLLRW